MPRPGSAWTLLGLCICAIAAATVHGHVDGQGTGKVKVKVTRWNRPSDLHPTASPWKHTKRNRVMEAGATGTYLVKFWGTGKTQQQAEDTVRHHLDGLGVEHGNVTRTFPMKRGPVVVVELSSRGHQVLSDAHLEIEEDQEVHALRPSPDQLDAEHLLGSAMGRRLGVQSNPPSW
eukprot:scaffold3602_cov636-Pavlova_lutheri.AAC.1